MMAMVAFNSNNLFTSHEMEELKGKGGTLNLIIGVQDVFGTLWATLALIKSLTNFTLEEFDDWASWVIPTIRSHVRFTCELPFSYLFQIRFNF